MLAALATWGTQPPKAFMYNILARYSGKMQIASPSSLARFAYAFNIWHVLPPDVLLQRYYHISMSRELEFTADEWAEVVQLRSNMQRATANCDTSWTDRSTDQDVDRHQWAPAFHGSQV